MDRQQQHQQVKDRVELSGTAGRQNLKSEELRAGGVRGLRV